MLGVRNFASNLLAELAGIAISVIVAVVLVGTLAARQRRKTWDGVRTHLLRAIHMHLVDLATRLLMLRLVGDFARHRGEWEKLWRALDRTDASDPDVSQAIQRVADLARERFRARTLELDGKVEPDATPFLELVKGVNEELIRLRDVLTPIVLEVADEPALAERLLQLQEEGKSLRTYLSVGEDPFKLLLQSACEDVCDVCAVAADLDAYITS